MASHSAVQELLSTATSAIDVAEQFSYGLKKDKSTNLEIFKVQKDSNTKEGAALKGVIIDGHQVVAPGIPVPLEWTGTQEELKALFLNTDNKLTRAYDGVMLRIYHHNDQWMVSSSGMVCPTGSWGPPDARTIIDMYSDVEGEYDVEQLNKSYCYYVILVHQDHYGFTTPKSNKLVLVDVVDMSTMTSLPISNEEFSHFKSRQETITECREDVFQSLFREPEEYHEVDADNFGVTLFTPEGQIRVVDRNCQHATDLLPNLPDPREHWVDLLVTDPLDDLPETLHELIDYLEGGKDMQDYLKHFPSRRQLFQEMRSIFLDTVACIVEDYDDIITSREERTQQPFINGRRLRFTHELVDEFSDGDATEVELAYFLSGEDAKRIYFLLNPHNVAPRQPQASYQTVIGEDNESGTRTLSRRVAVSDLGQVVDNKLVLE